MVHWLFRNSGFDPYQVGRFSSANEWVEGPTVKMHLIMLDLLVLGLAGGINGARLTKDLIKTKTKKVFSFSRDAWRYVSTADGAAEMLEEGWEEIQNQQTPKFTSAMWNKGSKDPAMRGHFDQLLGKDPDPSSDQRWSPLVEEVEEKAWRKGHPNTFFAYVWNTYFAVSKGIGKLGKQVARAILNAKPANLLFKRPRAVNLCDPGRVAKLVAQKLGPLRCGKAISVFQLRPAALVSIRSPSSLSSAISSGLPCRSRVWVVFSAG